MRYRVLGPLDVVADDGQVQFVGGPKQRIVLAVLVAAAGRAVSVDRLLQAMYGEDAAPNNRATMHTYVSNLRRALGDVVVRQGDGYVLQSIGSTTDAVEFEDAYRAATALVAPDEVAGGLRDALLMWRGHPYADVEGHGLLDGEITRLNEVRLTALEARIDADMRAGRHREVVAELDALTVEHPFRENLRALHMLALYRSGRQGEALRAYGRTRTALVEGLGIDPSPQLQEMERRILAQDRTLMITVGPTVQRRAVLVADIDGPWPDPAARDMALARRDSELAAAAGRCGGITLTPRGMAGYAVFVEPIHAVRAAQAVVNDRTRIAIDFGDLELGEDEPMGPPLVRAARFVAVANPGQALCSSASHQALTLAGVSGWAAASLGRFDIVGLDGEVDIYQLVGGGFGIDFPPLQLDRLPPLLPRGSERSVPGFELRSLIGVGELGEVHRAYQPSVGREVAVRIFETGMVEHPQFVRRFESVLQRVTRVEHPTVVPLLDYWREPSRAVMVSRLMTGGHLGERIPDGGFPPVDALAIFETVAAGVASAHRHGVVHGRLRPENILFDDEGNAYVADLGVDEICAGIITFATTAYDAPERLGGILATPAADIYSLGVLLQQLLSGTPPPLDRPLPTGHDRVAEVIARALDTDPSARPQTVDDLVVQLREALAVAVDPTFAAARNPYRGLEAFEQADAADFFGRENAVAEMVGVLETEPLLVVVGPSGIGKSSVVKAGLVPALRRGAVTGSESWLVTETTPGRAPFDQLAAALERVATVEVPDILGEITSGDRRLDDIVASVLPDGSVVLLIVDQFEELFTETVDEHERRAFMDVLADVASRPRSSIRIIATLRADYFDRPLGYAVLGNVLRGRTVALGAMTATELADAIRRPAATVGVEVDAALVARITGEAERQPGALPLVQHAMAELFDRRQTNTITVGDLDESGGLSDALGQRAEAIYGELDESLRDQARRVFLNLVNVSEDHDNTRRRVRRTELEQEGLRGDELDALLPEFGRHRLLTFDRDPASRTPTVEVAHEALLDNWPRLRAWIEDARDDLLTRRRLAAAAADWVNAGSDRSFLYAGARLSAALSWVGDVQPDLSDLERGFIDAAVGVSETQLRQQVSANRRLRILVAASVVGVIVAVVGTVVAVGQAKKANRRRAVAEAAQLVETVRGEPDLSESTMIQLAVAADRRTSTPATKALLLDAVAHASGRSNGPDVGMQLTGDTPISTNGKILVGDDNNALGTVLDATTLQPLVRNLRPAPTVVVNTGTRLLGVNGATLETVDLQTGETVGPPPGVTAGPTRYALSPDGTTLAVATDTTDSRDPGAFTLYDVSSGQPRITLDPFGGEAIQGVTFSPDGGDVLSVIDGGQAIAWDATSGHVIFNSGLQGAATVTRVAMSPSGKVIALGRDNGSIQLWSDDGQQWMELALQQPHQKEISWIDFDSTGHHMVSTSRDGVSVVWDTATGLVVAGPQSFGGDGGTVTFFRPKSATSLVNVASGRTWNWDLPHDGLVTTVPGVNLGATVSASPEIRMVVGNANGASVYDPTSTAPRQVSVASQLTKIGVAASGDGKRFVVVYANGAVELHDTATGELLTLFDHRVEVFGLDLGDNSAQGTLVRRDIMIAVDGSGTRVAFQSTDHRIYVVDDSGTIVDTISSTSERQDVQALDLSDDGKELVVSTKAGEALWYQVGGSALAKAIALPGSGYDGHFVADDRISVVGSGGARIIDPRSSQPTKDLAVGADATRFAVDPTRRFLATEDATGSIQLWDAQLMSRVGEAIRVRGVNTAAPIRFTADGHYLLVSGPAETSWVDVSTADWRSIACGLVTEQLSPTDRARYLGSAGAPLPCP